MCTSSEGETPPASVWTDCLSSGIGGGTNDGMRWREGSGAMNANGRSSPSGDAPTLRAENRTLATLSVSMFSTLVGSSAGSASSRRVRERERFQGILKRLLREAFWNAAGELRDGLDFVIVARPAAGELAERDGEAGIATALREVLSDAGLAGSAEA